MRKVIVCGGGVAGLSAAIALARSGWSVDVYERSPAIREIGTGLFIKGNALRVLEDYGVLDVIRRDCVVLREARLFDRDGELLQRRVLAAVNTVWNVKREVLVRALLDRAVELGARVHINRAVMDVRPDGSVRIDDEWMQADLAVAADGVNSLARLALGLDRPVRAPRSGAIRLLVPRTDAESDDVTREFWSGRLRVGVSPCRHSETYCYLAAPLDDTSGTRTPVDARYWAAHFPKLAAEGLFDRAEIAGSVHHPYPLVRARAWVKGKVALVGDAVHALPPTLGQGAGLALTNTLLLAHYLAELPDMAAALAAWERDWRWVSDRTQTWARRYDWVASEWPPSVYPLRDAVIWAMGKSRRFNSYMRIADRVDAPHQRILPPPSAPAR
jgi:2-polyprenyl-6-methoxyphenol hydroxylase-like FAD-dependent oxidoreductase